jgi:hypothetical protein
LQPDEAEQGRRVPPRSAVQQDAEFGPPRQQPAAALGAGFELGDQQPRVVGPGRLPGELDLFRRRDVEQPAAQLLNLLEQPRVNFLDPALSTCKNGRFSEVFCNLAPSSVVLGHGFSQKARVFDGFPC